MRSLLSDTAHAVSDNSERISAKNKKKGKPKNCLRRYVLFQVIAIRLKLKI